MQVNETKAEGLEREFQITIPATEINTKVTARLSELAQQVNLPGFRPGKAPMSILKKKYGNAVTGEVLQEALNQTTFQVMNERKIRPVGQPSINISKYDDGGDLEFTMNVEMAPEFEPVDLKSLKLERLVAEPADEELEASLKRVADANRSVEKISDDRASKKGDIVVIDFTGSIDGVEFPGGKADDYQLELGSGSFVPGFEDQVIGAKVGDEKTVEVDFPADYGAANLAGKKASFKVKVKEIREAKAGEIGDELAKKLNMEDRKSIRLNSSHVSESRMPSSA